MNDINNNDNLIVKLDHKITGNESFAVRYAFGNDNQTFPFGSLGGSGSGSRLAPFAQISPTRVNVVSASLLSTLGASRVNELRFGYTRFSNSFTSADAKADLTIPGLNFGTNHAGLPEFDFAGAIENLGATAFSVPRARTSQSYQILDNFTWIHGVHTFKFGGEYRRVSVSAFNDNLERGLLGFAPTNNDTTLDATIIDVLTNFYLGNAECDSCFTTANTGNTQRTTYNNGTAFFAQDDYRLRPNLTLNLGVRWEYFGPISEKNGLRYNIATNAERQCSSMSAPAASANAYPRDLNNFGPRLGLAWSPWMRTTVRAGYGIFYDYIPQHLMIANFTDVAGIATNPVGPIPVLPMGFNQGVFTGEAAGPIFSIEPPPYEIFAVDPHLRTPYVGSWN